MGWNHNDLTAATGASQPITPPCGYMFTAQGTQHVDYVGFDGHIHELWWDASGWHHNDLTNASGAPVQTANSRANYPTGYVFPAASQQHVDFVGDDGHIHELWWDSGGWHHNDLSHATGAPAADPGAPAGYAFAAQGTQHVDYVGADGHIHELWWDNDGWHHNDLSNATGAPAAVPGAPAGYAFAAQGTQHVDYIGEDGHIHELWWDSDGWHHNDLSEATGAPTAIPGAPAGYVFAAKNTQHVDYTGDDGHIHELWWDSSGWHHVDITDVTGTEGVVGGVLCAYVFEGQGTRHVDVIGGDGQVQELWWDSDGWHHNDLSNATGAPLADFATPAGYVFAAQGTQHVIYIGIADFHVHELWWQPDVPVAPTRPEALVVL